MGSQTPSKYLDVKQAVLDLLTDSVPTAAVSWGWDKRKTDRVSLVLTETNWDQWDWAFVGNKRINEDFNLGVVIWVQKPGGTNYEAESDAYDIFATLETAFRANPTLSGLVDKSTLRPIKSGSGPMDGGSEAVFELAFNATRRI